MNDHNIPSIIQENRKNAFPPPNNSPFQIWETVLEKSTCGNGGVGVLAKEFINQVEKNFREQHSPLFYASKLNITKSYLRKICQWAIGMPPSRCIQARLMLEACELLKSPKLSIKEVASRIGFEDASHFSKLFKGHSGLSPDCYRNSHLKNT